MAKVKAITAHQAIEKMNSYKEELKRMEAACIRYKEERLKALEELQKVKDKYHIDSKLLKSYRMIARTIWVQNYLEGE